MRKSALFGFFLLAGVCSQSPATDAHAQANPPSPPQQPAQGAPSGAAMTVATGQLHSILHKTSGTASILSTAGGSHVLRLENFQTSNGPDVRVYLVKGTNADNNDFIKAGGDNFVDLGALKGNKGDQNYAIPPNVNLDEYKSVSIWCKRFAVNYGAAPLEPTGKAMP